MNILLISVAYLFVVGLALITVIGIGMIYMSIGCDCDRNKRIDEKSQERVPGVEM